MKTIKNRYNYDQNQLISKQYEDKQLFNGHYKCFDIQTNQHYLLSHLHFKIQNKSQITSLHKKYLLIKQKLSSHNNKYLSKIYDVFIQKGNSLYLVLQWIQGGSILDYIGKIYILDWKTAIKIITAIYNGLQQLHKHDITNCFINLQNIQIDQNGIPKLSFKCLIYKTLYLSPQFRKSHIKSKQSDIYCLGICFYRLIFGVFPFKAQKNDQFIEQVKKGPSFIVQKVQNNNGQFPIICPIFIQQILRNILNFQPVIRNQIIHKLQQYNKYLIYSSALEQQIYNKIFMKSKYINLFTCLDQSDQHDYVIIDKKQKRILKLTLIHSSSEQIQNYIKETINKFAKISNQNFLKIYEYQVIQNQYLSIVYSYCSDGNLLQYKKNNNNQQFSNQIIQKTIKKIKQGLKVLEFPYNYLTNQNIFIKNGQIKIKFHDFQSKRFNQMIKKINSNKKQSHFIAPQILAGKSSKTADSWSVGILQYWMIFNQMPLFDKNGTLVLNKRQKLNKQKILNFHKVLHKDQNVRQNIINTVQQPQIIQKQNNFLQSQDKKLRKSGSPVKQSKKNNEQIKKQRRSSETVKQTKEQNQKKGNKETKQFKQIKQTKQKEKQKSKEKQQEKLKQQLKKKQKQKQNQKQKQKQQTLIQKQNKYKNQNKQQKTQKKIKQTKQDLGKQSPVRRKNKEIKKQINQINNSQAKMLIQQPEKIEIKQQIKRVGVGNKFSLQKIEKVDNKQKNQNQNQNQIKNKQNKINKIGQFIKNKLSQIKVLGELQKSYSKSIRIIFKCLIGIILYLFLFYFNFFKINAKLIADRNAYQVETMNIRAFSSDSKLNINYTLITKTPIQTKNLFYNTTLNVLRDDYRCVLNGYSVESDVLGVIQSSGFVAFQVFGILIAIINMILLIIVLGKLDLSKALSLINFQEKTYYSLYNWFIVNLAIISLNSLHYLIYGGLYHLKLQPCLSKTILPGVQFLFKSWISSWAFRFIVIYIGIIIAYSVILYFILNPIKKIHKNIYITLIILYFIGIGLRGIGKSLNQYQNIFGICSQLLAIIVGISLILIDIIFLSILQIKERTYIEKNNQIVSIDQFNKTQQYLSYDYDQKQ